MIDDIVNDVLGRLFGEAIGRRLPASRRAQLLFRIFFGLLGAGLAVAGPLLVLVVQGPLSAVAAALGLSARKQETADGRKWLFVMTGVNLSFATFAVMFVVLKVMLGRSI